MTIFGWNTDDMDELRWNYDKEIERLNGEIANLNIIIDSLQNELESEVEEIPLTDEFIDRTIKFVKDKSVEEIVSRLRQQLKDIERITLQGQCEDPEAICWINDIRDVMGLERLSRDKL